MFYIFFYDTIKTSVQSHIDIDGNIGRSQLNRRMYVSFYTVRGDVSIAEVVPIATDLFQKGELQVI